MIDFRTLIEETELSKESNKRLSEYGLGGHRMNKHIKAGEYDMSIQFSEYHYCSPRISEDDPNFYDSMEIAIFKDRKWVQPRNDEYIQNFPRFQELIERVEDGDVAVGGWVPVDVIQELYDYLCKSQEVT
jgi:hypothetical protein